MDKVPIYRVIITGYSHNTLLCPTWYVSGKHLQLHHDASLVSPELHVLEDGVPVYTDTQFRRVTPDQYSYQSSPIPDDLLSCIRNCNMEVDLSLSYVHMIEVLSLEADNCKTFVEYFNAYSTLLQMVYQSDFHTNVKKHVEQLATTVMNRSAVTDSELCARMWGAVSDRITRDYGDRHLATILSQVEYLQELSLIWNWK